jgi:HAE1 family hydrophobic/amphiphilic exporter-1
VVRENIVRHAGMRVNGRYKGAREAAMEGTAEIGLAVLATTLSIVAVFLPVGFMGGIIGRFFHQFGVTVAAAVLISMFVSFTLDPMLSSVWHDPEARGEHPKRGWYANTIGRVLNQFERLVNWFSDQYQHALQWSLRHRIATLVLAVAITVIEVALIISLMLAGGETNPKRKLCMKACTGPGKSATLADIGVGLALKPFRIDATLSNLFDARYFTASGNGFAVYPGDPRTFSVRVSVGF